MAKLKPIERPPEELVKPFWDFGAATISMEGDVWLETRPRLRIEDVYVTTSVREL